MNRTECTSNPIVVQLVVFLPGLCLLPDAILKLSSLQPHVLQAVAQLGLDLLALHRKSFQHLSTARAMFVQCLTHLVCGTNTHV